jgi:hypothetical protein
VYPSRASNLDWSPFGGCQGAFLAQEMSHAETNRTVKVFSLFAKHKYKRKGSKSHPRLPTHPPGSSQPSLITCLFSDVSSDSPDPGSFMDPPGPLDMLGGHKVSTLQIFFFITNVIEPEKKNLLHSLSAEHFTLLVG